MRQALFGATSISPKKPTKRAATESPIVTASTAAVSPRKANKAFIPKLKVTLRVGNEFEGETEMFIYEADTLSKLQAELDATKAARKKFRYIELVSVLSKM